MKFNVAKKDRKKSGIYRISNTIDDRIYYGSAERFLARYNSHKHALLSEDGKKANKHLFNFVKKHGFDKLVFEIMEFCPRDILHEREQAYLDELFSDKKRRKFNIAKKALNCSYLNLTQPNEQSRRISAALKGKKKPKSYSVNFSLSRGRPIGKFSKDGVLLEEFKTNLFVKRAGYDAECVRRVCTNERNSYLGYFWAYLTDENGEKFDLDLIRMSFHKKVIRPEREVCLFSMDGKFLKEFANSSEVAKFLNLDSHAARFACLEQRPISNKIILYKDIYGVNDLSSPALDKVLSPKLYSAYTVEGERIIELESLSRLSARKKLSRTKILRSFRDGIEYNGLFWIQE